MRTSTLYLAFGPNLKGREFEYLTMPFTVIPDLFYFFTIFPVASSKLLKKHSYEHRGGYIKPSSASTTCCIGGQPCRTGREEGTYVCSHQLPKYPITTPLVSLSPNLRLLAPPLLSPSLTHAHIRFHVSGASHPSNSL